jgi:hypothetical protein
MYASAAASMMSVLTPWPDAFWPESSSTTLASPSASWPAMRKSRSLTSRVVAALMARKTASIGPSPVKSPRTLSPAGVRMETVACGGRRVDASTSNHSSV